MPKIFKKLKEGKKPVGLTSEEAGALIVSGGRTKDVDQADDLNNWDGQDKFKAMLAEQMGFEFKVKISPNFVHFYSVTPPRVSARARINKGDVDEYGNITSEDLIERMVNAALVLQQRWSSKAGK